MKRPPYSWKEHALHLCMILLGLCIPLPIIPPTAFHDQLGWPNALLLGLGILIVWMAGVVWTYRLSRKFRTQH